MGYGNFEQANRTIQPKWLVKNENTLRFDLAIQRNEVWDDDRKSLYIRSIIYGYPVGSFYAQDNNDSYLWMLDGKQRFTTIIQYINGNFALTKNTPPIKDVELANKKFEELPEDFQDELKTRNLTLFTYKNMTEEERDHLFLFLNNGMTLTKMELTRVMASSNVMEFINEISNYKLFKNIIAISDGQRNRFTDQEIILQVLSILINGYTKGFSSKELQEFALKLKEDGIQDNIREIMKDTTDYIYQAIPVKEKFMKKVNIPIIFNIADEAQKREVTPEKFGGFLQMFFNDIPTEYDYATDSGSAKKENVKIRIDEMNKYFDENIDSAPDYKLPVVKPKGKAGRPLGSTKNKEEKLADSQPPAEPTPMAAAGNPS